MNLIKKISLIALLGVIALGVTGCGTKNVEGTLEELMTTVYAGIPDEEKPMMLENVEVTDENREMFLGNKELDIKSALASESGVGSIAHSVVLMRAEEDSDIEATKKLIKDNIDPRKWVCVEAEKVVVDNVGDLIILIMADEKTTTTIHNNFLELAE